MTFDEWKAAKRIDDGNHSHCAVNMRYAWEDSESYARVGMVSVEAVCQWIADDSCHRHGTYCACGGCVYGGRIAEQLRTMSEKRDGR